jgi:hypothetical protein
MGELLRDLRVFTGTNAVLFLLAFFVAGSRWAHRRLLLVLSASLVGAALLGTWFYLFQQDWLHTLIYANYVGTAYVVWVGLLLLAELDVLLNKGRLLRALVDGAGALLAGVGP